MPRAAKNAARHHRRTRHRAELTDEEISPNGDLLLIVGREKARMRVDSHTLMASSDILKALLNDPARETHSGSATKEIQLEEDDPEVMWTLCCILHKIYEVGDEEMAPTEVFLMAMHVKKFDLMGREPIRKAMNVWLNPQLSSRFNCLEMGFHLAAAYMLHHLASVVRWSQDLIFGHTGPYNMFVADVLTRIVPAPVFVFLDELRAEARADVERLLGVDLWGLVRRFFEAREEMRTPLPETDDAVNGILSVLRLINPETVSAIVMECEFASRYLYQPCPHSDRYPIGLKPVLHAIEYEKFRRISCLLIFTRKTGMRLQLSSRDARPRRRRI